MVTKAKFKELEEYVINWCYKVRNPPNKVKPLPLSQKIIKIAAIGIAAETRN